jgi:hypothetical protein
MGTWGQAAYPSKSLFKFFVQQSFIVVIIFAHKFAFRTLFVRHRTSTGYRCLQDLAWTTPSIIMAPKMQTNIMDRQQKKTKRHQRQKLSNVIMELSSISPSRSKDTPRNARVKTPNQDIVVLSLHDSHKNKTISEDLKVLLQHWMEHTHVDYHTFTRQEAAEIRLALLHWYTAHRRKLPWRGDPPPFDGSTSGRSNSQPKNNNRKRKSGKMDENSPQPLIQSFMLAMAPTRSITKAKHIHNNSLALEVEKDMAPNGNANPSFAEEAIPVTGYGIWVSEIMLQQTRVEAVIPYWIRCKCE